MTQLLQVHLQTLGRSGLCQYKLLHSQYTIPCLALTQNERFSTPLDGFVFYVLPETQMILCGDHGFVQRQFTFCNVVGLNFGNI